MNKLITILMSITVIVAVIAPAAYTYAALV